MPRRKKPSVERATYQVALRFTPAQGKKLAAIASKEGAPIAVWAKMAVLTAIDEKLRED